MILHRPDLLFNVTKSVARPQFPLQLFESNESADLNRPYSTPLFPNRSTVIPVGRRINRGAGHALCVVAIAVAMVEMVAVGEPSVDGSSPTTPNNRLYRVATSSGSTIKKAVS